MSRYRKYKQAFRVACELINGDFLFGYDTDLIFKEIIKKEGFVCSDLIEKFILENLKVLRGLDNEQIKLVDEGENE